MLSPDTLFQAEPACVLVSEVDPLTSKPEMPKGAAGSMALVLVAEAKSLLNAKNSVWLSALKLVKSAALAGAVYARNVAMVKVSGRKR